MDWSWLDTSAFWGGLAAGFTLGFLLHLSDLRRLKNRNRDQHGNADYPLPVLKVKLDQHPSYTCGPVAFIGAAEKHDR